MLLFSGGPISKFHSTVGVRDRPSGRRRAALPPAGVCRRGRPAADHRGLELTAPHGLEAISRAGTVVVPAWRSITSPPPEEALDAAPGTRGRRPHRRAVHGARSSLAAAGLLDGRPATTHWMYAPTLAKRYPSVHVDPAQLFVDDGDVLTSAGTAAGIDLCLPHRADGPRQRGGRRARPAPGGPAAPVGRPGALPRPVFTGGDRRRPARRGRRLGAGTPPRAVRRGDAGGTRLHEPPYVRPPVPLADRERSAAVADHAAGAPGAAAAGDVGLLRGRGGGPVQGSARRWPCAATSAASSARPPPPTGPPTGPAGRRATSRARRSRPCRRPASRARPRACPAPARSVHRPPCCTSTGTAGCRCRAAGPRPARWACCRDRAA